MTTLITAAKETSVKRSVGDTLLKYHAYLIYQDKSHKLESNKKRVDNLVSRTFPLDIGKNPGNGIAEWISRFFCCTMIRVILN